MKTVRQSVIVARPAEAMFRLVDEAERYPEFLPWCSAAQIHERTPEHTRATLEIDYRGMKSRITTVNRNVPPGSIDLEYAFSNGALESLLAPVFGYVSETLVDHFVKRAESAP